MEHIIRENLKKLLIYYQKRYKKKIPSPKETGSTFIANSRLKAKYFSNFVNFPVISDDSGICVKSLNNKPGIFSARLAKEKGSFLKSDEVYFKKKKIKKIDQPLSSAVCHLNIQLEN